MSRANIGRRLSTDELATVLRYRRDGFTIRQTAAACNLNKDTVFNYAPDWLVAAIRKICPPLEKNQEAG